MHPELCACYLKQIKSACCGTCSTPDRRISSTEHAWLVRSQARGDVSPIAVQVSFFVISDFQALEMGSAREEFVIGSAHLVVDSTNHNLGSGDRRQRSCRPLRSRSIECDWARHTFAIRQQNCLELDLPNYRYT